VICYGARVARQLQARLRQPMFSDVVRS